MVKISVIIPVFNDEKYLRECLDSVCNQTLEDIEVICINDGSTDKSLQILEDYAENDSRLIVLNQSNQGSAISRNNGLDIAKGEYIGFLDADDLYIDESGLERLYETGMRNDSDMVSANLKFLTGKRKIIPNPHYDRGTFHYFCKDESIMPDDYGIPFYFYKNIYKASLISNIRFPNLLRGQDPVFLSQLLSEIKRIDGVAVDFYGYMVPLTFSKLDSYAKKHDYIMQYKQCFDILSESELFKTCDKYINNLVMYLNDTVDSEVYEIVMDVFRNDLNYFKNHEDEYHDFKVRNILNNILEKNTEEYYHDAKRELADESGLKILNESDSLEDYKIRYFTNELESYNREYDELVNMNDVLKNEYEAEKSFNENTLNSKSWKLLNRFRKIRRGN